MEKKIRVLRILNRLNLGGPTYNAVYLTKYISKNLLQGLWLVLKLNPKQVQNLS